MLAPLTTDNPNSLLSIEPEFSTVLDDFTINLGNDGEMNTRGGGNLGNDDYGVLWTGELNVGVNGSPITAGDITFATASDDGSVVYIDINANGVFEPAELLVDNNFVQGVTQRFGSTNLVAGVYPIAMGYFERSGGAVMRAKFFQGITNDFAAMTFIHPADSGQVGMFSFEDIPSGSLSNNLIVNSNSTVVLSSDLPDVSLQNLSVNGDTQLTIESSDGAQDLEFSGAVSVAGGAAFSLIGRAIVTLPAITETTASTITQQGDGCLILTASNVYSGVTTVNGGVLEVRELGGLGDIAAGTIVHTNAALLLNGVGNLNYTLAEPLELHGHGNNKLPAAFSHAAGNNDQFYGPITLGADATILNPNNEFSLYGVIDNAGFELRLVGTAGNFDIEGTGGLQGSGNIVADGINGRIRMLNSTQNTFDGNLTVNNIIWDCHSGDSFGSTVGDTVVNQGARIELRNGRTFAENITVHGDDNGAGGIRQENNSNTLTGTITLGSNVMIHANQTQLTITGDIVGPYNLIKRGLGALILEGDKNMGSVTLVEGLLRINSAQGLGGTADMSVPATAILELADGVSFDGSGSLESILMAGGALNVFDSVSTLSLPIKTESRSEITLGGAGDLIIDSDMATSGPVVDDFSAALTHYGFHTNDLNQMDLDGNGGLFNMGDPTNHPAFFGDALLTVGPNNRGLDFNSDQDFLDSGAIGRNDDYLNLWIGYFNCNETGIWDFRRTTDDDQAGLWMDLNTNGVFESTQPGLGSNRGEQLSYDSDGGAKFVSLTNGVQYLVAFLHREGAGNSHVEFRFRRPGSTFDRVVHPVAQAGLWSPYDSATGVTSNSLRKTGSGTVTLNGTNTYDAGTLVLGGTLAPRDVDAMGGAGGDLTVGAGTLALSGSVVFDLNRVDISGIGAVGSLGPITSLNGDNVLNGTELLTQDALLSNQSVSMGAHQGSLVVNAPEIALRFSDLLFLGDGDVIFNPDVVSSESNTVTMANALYHFGFHTTSEAGLDLDRNGGLIANGNPRSHVEYFGETIFTNGPSGGLRYGTDAEFIATGAVGRGDNYSNLFLGQFNCNQTGAWGFRNALSDDRAGMWIDINQNGVFESSLPGLGDNRGEQLIWENTGNKTVNLVQGEKYMVAFTHHEFGGGSNIEFQLTPPGGAQVRVDPSDPAQAGLWNLTELSPSNRVVKNGSGTLMLNGSNAHIGETMVHAGTLIATQNDSLGRIDSGTIVNAGTLALDGGVTLTGEAISLGGDIVGLSGTNIVTGSMITVQTNVAEVGIGAAEGTLIIDVDVDLAGAGLAVDGAGDTALNGVISGLGTSFLLPGFPLPSIYDFNDNVATNFDISGWTAVVGSAGAHNQGAGDEALSAGRTTGDYAHDNAHTNCLVSSPAFKLDRSGDPITFNLQGGMKSGSQAANTNLLPVNVSEVLVVGMSSNATGVQGVGLRRVDTGDYVWTASKSANGGSQDFSMSTTGLDDTAYVFDFFDTYSGGWGWLDLDDVVIPGNDEASAMLVENNITKTGSGTATITGVNTYEGTTFVGEGILMAESTSGSPSNVVVQADGVLAGNGVIAGDVMVETRGTVSPGAGIGLLSADGSITFTDYSSVLQIDLRSDILIGGSDFDVLDSGDQIVLNNATLQLNGLPGLNASLNSVISIARSMNGIVGTFNELPEGARVSANGAEFVISYSSNNITFFAAAGMHPFAAPDTIFRSPDSPVSRPASFFVANDLPGDGLSMPMLTGVSATSIANGTVSLNAGIVTYTPEPGYTGDDSFTYTMTDGTDIVTGLVTVRAAELSTGPAVGNLAGLFVLPNGDYRVAFTGDADAAYDVDFTTDLNAQPVVWTNLGLVQSDSSGNIEIDHATPPEPVVYYRALPQ